MDTYIERSLGNEFDTYKLTNENTINGERINIENMEANPKKY